MTITNTLFNLGDLDHSLNVMAERQYPQNFPHQDLWTKTDAIIKWISVLERFQELYPENGVKVVDLGCARGCVPHIIDSWGNDVTGVDTPVCGGRLDHDCEGSNVKMVNSNAFDWFPTVDDESIDVFIDLCAYAHFCGPSGVCPDGEQQFTKIFREINRCLKPGGHVIISSDVNMNTDVGEFMRPSAIIALAKQQGLSLVGRWTNRKKNLFNVPNFSYLNVCRLTFVKNA